LPWCEKSGMETIEIVRARRKGFRNLPFKYHPLIGFQFLGYKSIRAPVCRTSFQNPR
jgi:hypothetical protein